MTSASDPSSPLLRRGTAIAPLYRERLRVPLIWWFPPVFFLLVFTAGGYRYSGVPAAIGTAVVFAGLVWLLLHSYGAIDLILEPDRFRAGPLTVACSALGVAAPLDREQARLLRGVRADARAPLMLRGYIAAAVRLDVLDPNDPAPYWYVSTRHPHELAAALNAARASAVGG